MVRSMEDEFYEIVGIRYVVIGLDHFSTQQVGEYFGLVIIILSVCDIAINQKLEVLLECFL